MSIAELKEVVKGYFANPKADDPLTASAAELVKALKVRNEINHFEYSEELKRWTP